ncbi:MAG: HEAT repeat domain-containing protein, partial [Planctomycetaceae bacterium]|nr:HEAT repeat domain-containing protein [Planctomycetaceae bacterium]
EAKAAFRAALEEDPACEEAARAIVEAEAGPGGIEEELKDRITALVWKLGGPEREQADHDLRRIGARAVPFLEEGLRSADVGIVTGAATILSQIRAAGARGALARAVADPKIAFPDIVRGVVDDIPQTGHEVDLAGRCALLRAVVRMEEPARTPVLRRLLGRGFFNEPAAAVGPLVVELLAEADDGARTMLLDTQWGPASTVIAAAAVPYLRSGNADLRSGALTACSYAQELSPPALDALRRVLEEGEPVERARAFRILVVRGLVPPAEQVALVNRFLVEEDVQVLDAVLHWIAPPNSGPAHWEAAYAPGFLAGIRKALESKEGDRIQRYTRVLVQAGPDLSEEDLIDLMVRCSGVPTELGSWSVVETALAHLSNRMQSQAKSGDRAVLDRVFLLGLGRLEREMLKSWVSKWGSLSHHLAPESLCAFAEGVADPELRQTAWHWILQRPDATWPAFSPKFYEALAADLLDADVNVLNNTLRIASTRPDPSLAPALRQVIARTTNEAQLKERLRILVKCAGKGAQPALAAYLARVEDPALLLILIATAGKDAIPDVRDYVRRTGNRDALLAFVELAGREAAPELRWFMEKSGDTLALQKLVELLGPGAIPDVRAFLLEHGGVFARDELVRLAGRQAVPILVEWALASDRPAWRVLCGSTTSGPPPVAENLSVPPEVAVAFFEAFPEEKRTGILFQQVSFVLPAEKRNAYVNGYLSDPRPDMAAAAAWVVRRFNMVEYWPRLLPLLDNADEKVRIEAQEALDSIRKYRELKESFERYGMEGSKKALDDAAALAKDPDPVKRKGAALALGALGEPSGVPLLLALLDDKDPSVREAALSALERLGGK